MSTTQTNYLTGKSEGLAQWPDTKTMASPASVTESVQTRSLVIMGCERAQRICRAVGSLAVIILLYHIIL